MAIVNLLEDRLKKIVRSKFKLFLLREYPIEPDINIIRSTNHCYPRYCVLSRIYLCATEKCNFFFLFLGVDQVTFVDRKGRNDLFPLVLTSVKQHRRKRCTQHYFLKQIDFEFAGGKFIRVFTRRSTRVLLAQMVKQVTVVFSRPRCCA